jgi:hypothetical protein
VKDLLRESEGKKCQHIIISLITCWLQALHILRHSWRNHLIVFVETGVSETLKADLSAETAGAAVACDKEPQKADSK